MNKAEDTVKTEVKVKSNDIVGSSPETNDEIGASYATIHSEMEHEDDKNKLSVFINAISVKINMPPGTIKALIYCLFAIIVVGVIVLAGLIRDWSTSYYETADYQRRLEATKDRILEGKEYFAEHSDIVMPEKEVFVADEYAYILPAGSVRVNPELYGDMFYEAEGYSYIGPNGFEYVIRSYTMEGDAESLEADVLKRMYEADDVKEEDVSYEYIDVNGIRMLACTYLCRDEEEGDIYAVEYSWADSHDNICSVDISSPSKYNHKVATAIINTVHKVDVGASSGKKTESGSTPYADFKDAWDEQRMEEAMNSIGEEAMEEYMREEAKEQETYVTDPLFN